TRKRAMCLLERTVTIGILQEPVSMITFRTLVILAFFAGLLQAARNTETYNGRPVAAQQAILQVNLSKYSAQLPAILNALSATCNADDVRPLSKTLGVYLLHSRIANVTTLLNILKATPAISFAEPDYVVKPVTLPNDPNFSQQWD